MSYYDIDPKIYVDHEGKRIYLCCEGCKVTFLKYPDQFKPKLPQFGGVEEGSLGVMPNMSGRN